MVGNYYARKRVEGAMEILQKVGLEAVPEPILAELTPSAI